MAERQLDLLKGPRQRGTIAAGPTEFEMHCVVADYLRHGLSEKWVWFHPPNGGERAATFNSKGQRSSAEGGRLKRMGTRPGTSDFVFSAPPNGRFHALELKRKGEKPTEVQFAFLDDIEASGGIVAWVDSVNDAIAILRRWGAIRSNFDVQK